MVVEKLDKPKASSAYEIRQAPKTGDDRERRQQKDQGEKDEFSASAGIQGWQKFHATAANRKSIKLRRQDIEHLWFRQVALQKGIIIIELDVGLINGQVLKAVHTFLTRLEDYWKFKPLIFGQEIPIHEVVHEPMIEVSVLHKDGVPEVDNTAVAVSLTKNKQATRFWKLSDTKTGRFNSKAIIFYAILAALLLVLIFIIL